jgi:hypothetical protein
LQELPFQHIFTALDADLRAIDLNDVD